MHYGQKVLCALRVVLCALRSFAILHGVLRVVIYYVYYELASEPPYGGYSTSTPRPHDSDSSNYRANHSQFNIIGLIGLLHRHDQSFGN